MRLAVLGGTGRIGGHLLTALAGAGHEVTVLARGSGLDRDGAVTVVRGDAADPAAVRAAVDGADAVLSALGPRGAKTPALLGTAARAITAAMDKTGARRLICVSAAGAFIEDDPDTGRLVKLILPRIFATAFADTRDMEQVISGSGLDWTLVRATRLVNTAQTGRYRVRPEYPPVGGGKISRADVAHFMAAALAEGTWIGGRPALAY
jgi:putative NADH-flavin reductase